MRKSSFARPRTLLAFAAGATLIASATGAVAGPAAPKRAAPATSTPAPLPSGQTITPAAERSLSSEAQPAAKGARGAAHAKGTGEPMIHGPKLPEALRLQLQARLEARVLADVVQERKLRTQAIDLLH